MRKGDKEIRRKLLEELREVMVLRIRYHKKVSSDANADLEGAGP